MSVPKCPHCKTYHYFLQDCPEKAGPVSTNMANSVVDTPKPMANMANSEDSVMANESSTYRYRDKEKRREYMRDYMRKQRA